MVALSRVVSLLYHHRQPQPSNPAFVRFLHNQYQSLHCIGNEPNQIALWFPDQWTIEWISSTATLSYYSLLLFVEFCRCHRLYSMETYAYYWRNIQCWLHDSIYLYSLCLTSNLSAILIGKQCASQNEKKNANSSQPSVQIVCGVKFARKSRSTRYRWSQFRIQQLCLMFQPCNLIPCSFRVLFVCQIFFSSFVHREEYVSTSCGS